MLYSEIIAVCSQIHTKHINAMWEKNCSIRKVTDVKHKICWRIQAVI
jgi:hypothetical protein